MCGDQNSLKIEKDLGSEDLIDGVPIPIYLDRLRGVEILNHRNGEIKNISSIIQKPKIKWSPKQGRSKKTKVYTSLERRIYEMELSKDHSKLSAMELALGMLFNTKHDTTQCEIIEKAKELGVNSSKIKYGLQILRGCAVFNDFIDTTRLNRSVLFKPKDNFRSKTIDELMTIFSLTRKEGKDRKEVKEGKESSEDIDLLMKDVIPIITKIGKALKDAGFKIELKISN